WLTTAAVAGGTALCFAIDEPVRTYMVDHQSSFGDGINSFGQAYGSAVNALIFSGALYAGGAITGNSGVRSTGLMTLESVAIAGGLGVMIKIALGRSRPYTGDGAFKFGWFESQDAFLSMPSGHAIVAFAASSVLAARINYLPATIGLYTMAAL